MRKKKLLVLFLIIIFTILQCTVLNYLQILGKKPDILLILVIFFSLTYGKAYGMAVGVLCGFFSEATSNFPAGFLVFTYGLGGLLLGYVGSWVYRQTLIREMTITLIFAFSIYLVLFALFRVFNMDLPLLSTLGFTVLPASFYTACISPFFFHFLRTVLDIK